MVETASRMPYQGLISGKCESIEWQGKVDRTREFLINSAEALKRRHQRLKELESMAYAVDTFVPNPEVPRSSPYTNYYPKTTDCSVDTSLKRSPEFLKNKIQGMSGLVRMEDLFCDANFEAKQNPRLNMLKAQPSIGFIALQEVENLKEFRHARYKYKVTKSTAVTESGLRDAFRTSSTSDMTWADRFLSRAQQIRLSNAAAAAESGGGGVGDRPSGDGSSGANGPETTCRGTGGNDGGGRRSGSDWLPEAWRDLWSGRAWGVDKGDGKDVAGEDFEAEVHGCGRRRSGRHGSNAEEDEGWGEDEDEDGEECGAGGPGARGDVGRMRWGQVGTLLLKSSRVALLILGIVIPRGDKRQRAAVASDPNHRTSCHSWFACPRKRLSKITRRCSQYRRTRTQIGPSLRSACTDMRCRYHGSLTRLGRATLTSMRRLESGGQDLQVCLAGCSLGCSSAA